MGYRRKFRLGGRVRRSARIPHGRKVCDFFEWLLARLESSSGEVQMRVLTPKTVGGNRRSRVTLRATMPAEPIPGRGNDGRDWDIECVQASGEIWEVEREVQNPNDPLFKANVKVGEKAARKIVLENYPGHIREVEYEVEADGTAVYEFDIDMADGREMKVEINAANGNIHEANEEIWQIGWE